MDKRRERRYCRHIVSRDCDYFSFLSWEDKRRSCSNNRAFSFQTLQNKNDNCKMANENRKSQEILVP